VQPLTLGVLGREAGGRCAGQEAGRSCRLTWPECTNTEELLNRTREMLCSAQFLCCPLLRAAAAAAAALGTPAVLVPQQALAWRSETAHATGMAAGMASEGGMPGAGCAGVLHTELPVVWGGLGPGDPWTGGQPARTCSRLLAACARGLAARQRWSCSLPGPAERLQASNGLGEWGGGGGGGRRQLWDRTTTPTPTCGRVHDARLHHQLLQLRVVGARKYGRQHLQGTTWLGVGGGALRVPQRARLLAAPPPPCCRQLRWRLTLALMGRCA